MLMTVMGRSFCSVAFNLSRIFLIVFPFNYSCTPGRNDTDRFRFAFDVNYKEQFAVFR